MKRLPLLLFFTCALVQIAQGSSPIPVPSHVVLVILENHSYGDIIGSAAAPNINALANAGALIVPASSDPSATTSGSHSLRHPSQPNYLELYSGSSQGLIQDGYPGSASAGEVSSTPPPFNTPNLGAELIAAGFTFATYSESLPAVGSTVESYSDTTGLNEYFHKHNPASNWTAADAPANNHLPSSINQPFFPLPGQPTTGFPTDFTKLPTVSIVVPNEQHDMHDGTIQQADTWLQQNIFSTYLPWAQAHNSLLIVTFDEDGDNTPSNLIPTIFAGSIVTPGAYTETNINPLDTRTAATSGPGVITLTGTAMNHYNLLRTLETMYGLATMKGEVNDPPLTDIFTTPVTSGPNVVPNDLTTTQGDTGNLFPLFSPMPVHYQQVYAQGQFTRFRPGGEMIKSLSFRAHAPGLPFTGTVPQLIVTLSTTKKSPDGLSSTFAQNTGVDATQVFSGPLTLSTTNSSATEGPASFDLVITFSTPFLYDPARGNLLVDIQNTQGGTEVPPLDQELDATLVLGDSVSRVFNYGNASAAIAGTTGTADEKDTLGLVTQFGTVRALGGATELTGVVSRKVHGAVPYDVPLPVNGPAGIECRTGGANGNHTMIFSFANTLTSVGGASVTSGTGTVSSSSIGSNAHDYVVTLTGVTNAQTITVSLTNVNDSAGNSSSIIFAPMALLLGDVNSSGRVDTADVSLVKQQTLAPISNANFREDVNVSNRIDSADVSLVKQFSLTTLPAAPGH